VGGAAALIVAGALTAVPVASADELADLEQTLRKRFPKVAPAALAASPWRDRPRRLVFASGTVGAFYLSRADRAPLCVAARADAPELRVAIHRKVMPTAADERFWTGRGVLIATVIDIYRRGVLRACKLRGD